MTALKASVSSSMAARKKSFRSWPSSAISFTRSWTAAYFFLPTVRLPTMATRPAAWAAHRAATEPPPGAGLSVDSSSTNSRLVMLTSGPSVRPAWYSMIFSAGSKGVELPQAHALDGRLDDHLAWGCPPTGPALRR